MSFFTGASKKASQSNPATGINLQSSVYGKPVPIIYGQTKVAGNLILYGNFQSVSASQAAGGKGSMAGSGGGKGGGSSPTYTYFASFAFAVCEGPITGVYAVWKSLGAYIPASLGFAIYTGTYPQTAWGTTVSWSVTDGSGVTTSGTSSPLGYNGIAYVANPAYDLGTASELPNLQYTVQGVYWDSVSGNNDADPSLVMPDFMTNAHYGLGFPSAYIGDLTTWQAYCLAAGLLVSPAYTTQRTGTDMIDEMMLATNSACFFSSGLFQVVPYGDVNLTGNGKTYTAPTTPVYSLGDDDFIRNPQNNTGSSGSPAAAGPVLITRKRKSDTINSVKVEFLDQNNNYNPAIAIAENQAEIDSYGRRTNGSKTLHLFTNATSANLSANLQLRRQMVQNTYQFDLDQRYILLDPMDIIEITDTTMGIVNQLVRITEIQENDDGTLSFTCEEYLQGTGSAPVYSFSQGTGQPFQNIEAAPGTMNQPIFFEPPYALTGDLEVWIGASGPSNWGGAVIFISTDNANFQIAGTIQGSCRMGMLTADLATYTLNVTGQTIDQTNTLSVDLTESEGTLTSANATLAQNFSTLCFVDGELISFGTATLTATNKYDLTYLVRGCYGSTISAHSSGSNFVRVDNGVFKLKYTPDRVGQIIYVKFCSFNQYGGAQQSLAAAPSFSYTLGGTALSSALGNVTNLALAYIGNLMELNWTEVTDFRPILYEIRVGTSWDSAQFMSRVAHPPFRIQGDNTYWVAAYSQPAAGLIVYSATPTSIAVTGSNLPQNIVISHEEDPSWSGTLSGAVTKVGATIQSNGTGGGFYTIPTSDRVFITYPFACAIVIKWTSSASPLSNTMFQFKGNLSLTSGSTVISNIDLYSSAATLSSGSAVLTGISNTTAMGPGQYVLGPGSSAIPSGAQIFAILSTTSIQLTTSASTSGSNSIKVIPQLAVGQVVQTLNSTHLLSSACQITAVSTSLDSISVSPAPTVSGSTLVEISIDMFGTPDFFGAVPPLYATVIPQIRLSTDGGGTWSAWQNWQAGYYLGNGFDARMSITSSDVNTVAVLETFSFTVNAPDRIDHYNNIAVSSAGSTLVFRPDGASTTANFNGGQSGSSIPNVQATPSNQSAGQTVNVTNITTASCVLSFYSSAGTQQAGNVNVIAWGY